MLLLVANGLIISNFVMLELLHDSFTVVEVLFGLRAVLQDASVWWFYAGHSGGCATNSTIRFAAVFTTYTEWLMALWTA